MLGVLLHTIDLPMPPFTAASVAQVRESSAVELRLRDGRYVEQHTALNAVAAIQLASVPANPVTVLAELVVQLGKHAAVLQSASLVITTAGLHAFPLLKSTHVLAQRAFIRWTFTSASSTTISGRLYGELAGGCPYSGTV